ncbi:hypothetical protein Btru_047993 [Bulinus truncatus]|nr:hypothetical protein Btru_047993 [Bulinus truncatus]
MLSPCYVVLLSYLCLTVHGTTSDVFYRTPDILFPHAGMIICTDQQTLEVNCSAIGVPKPIYQWKKDGKVADIPGFLTFDSSLGTLRVTAFVADLEGNYRCLAINFINSSNNQIRVVSMSPLVTIKRIREWCTLCCNRIELQDAPELMRVYGKEFNYMKIHCNSEKILASADAINYNWYSGPQVLPIDPDHGRLYIDMMGTLHVTYLKRTDGVTLRDVKCGLSSEGGSSVVLGAAFRFTVAPTFRPAPVAPELEYFTIGLKRMISQTAVLECVFSGYDPKQPLPLITWTKGDGIAIRNYDKYMVSADGRQLTIYNVAEHDEGNYYCGAKNNAGETRPRPIFLNVTSPPIFLENKAPRDVTVTQGQSAVIPCQARSALNEKAPSPVTWFINGEPTNWKTNKTKFDIQLDSLTIKSARKPDDIMCVQCVTTNSEGELMGEACVHVG